MCKKLIATGSHLSPRSRRILNEASLLHQPPANDLRLILLKQTVIVRIRNTTRRLKRRPRRRPPPRARSPPRRTEPHVRVRRQVLQQPLHRRVALAVRPTSELAQHAALVVLLQPLSGADDAVDADSGGDAGRAGARAVGIEVLVHLVDELVLGIGEGGEVGVGRVPCPGAGPGVAFGEDVLRGGAGAADGVDGGLVEVEDEVLVHVVVFIVDVEDLGMKFRFSKGRKSMWVMQKVRLTTLALFLKGAAKWLQNVAKSLVLWIILPAYLSKAIVSTLCSRAKALRDSALPAIVMGIDHGVSALAGNVVDSAGVVIEIRALDVCGDGSNGHALHHKRNSEEVEALADEGLESSTVCFKTFEKIASYGYSCIVGKVKVDTPCTWNGSTKFGDRLTDTKPLQSCKSWSSSKRSSRQKQRRLHGELEMGIFLNWFLKVWENNMIREVRFRLI